VRRRRVRIVSLVPGATEMLFLMGLGDSLVGRSAECDHPAPARALPTLTAGGPEGQGSSRQIDEAVRGGDRPSVLGERLAALRPDVVVTQGLCHACGPTADDLAAAEAAGASILALSPARLRDVIASAEALGGAVGEPALGASVSASLSGRLERVRERSRARAPIRVVGLEWLAPVFLTGHWIPDQIRAAGGEDPLGAPGGPARPADIADVIAAQPEGVLLVPCGWGAERAAREADREGILARLAASEPPPTVIALDADGCFSRPGPRVVEGVEALAARLERIRVGAPGGALL